MSLKMIIFKIFHLESDQSWRNMSQNTYFEKDSGLRTGLGLVTGAEKRDDWAKWGHQPPGVERVSFVAFCTHRFSLRFLPQCIS